ncbi:MAG TPA: hypothetical protein VGD80_11050, partial [Kofleriaceae bacterium]
MEQQARHPARSGPRRRGTSRSIAIAAWLHAFGVFGSLGSLGALGALAACDGAGDELARDEQGRVIRPVVRDIDELERVKLAPRECAVHGDCPDGSRCDLAVQRCAWDCLADSDCGPDHTCSVLGACLASGAPPAQVPDPIAIDMANDSPDCRKIDPAVRREVLLHLNAEQRSCENGDDSCPCGAYCSRSGVCQVDCIADDPPPELTCGDGEACTPLGRCAESPHTPPPPLELTLATSPSVLVANTVGGPVVVEVQITVSTVSTAILLPEHPAKVFVGIAERRDVEPGVLPRVKCAPGDALDDHCDLDGGWLFDVQSGSLQSQPRTVWVELPRVSEKTSWTLEVGSEWALAPATTALDAVAVAIPATDPGHYRGTLRLTNPGAIGPLLDRWPRVPIEAIVTPNRVALVEPMRGLLPDGQAVLPREDGQATMVRWLDSDATAGTALAYDARLRLAELAYDAVTGTLSGGLELTLGVGGRDVATSYQL